MLSTWKKIVCVWFFIKKKKKLVDDEQSRSCLIQFPFQPGGISSLPNFCPDSKLIDCSQSLSLSVRSSCWWRQSLLTLKNKRRRKKRNLQNVSTFCDGWRRGDFKRKFLQLRATARPIALCVVVVMQNRSSPRLSSFEVWYVLSEWTNEPTNEPTNDRRTWVTL